jgi:Tfp pilus assembly protein PilP
MRVCVLGFLVCGFGALVNAQTAKRPAEKESAADAKPAAAESYTYEPGGRRDPFVSVLGSGVAPPPVTVKRADGAAGLTIAEISLRGILQSRGALVAMVQGPDRKSYLVHQGDKFADGAIKAITSQGLVIVQNVNDPLSVVKQREIRKQLRSVEDPKQ